MTKELIITIALAMILIFIVISVVKKALKILVFLIILLAAIFLVDIFIYGQTPVSEINAYVTNIKYTKNLVSLTARVSQSASNIKTVLEKGTLDEGAIDTLKRENNNLHRYQNELTAYRHTDRMQGIDNAYRGYLNTLVTISDLSVKASSAGGKTIQNAKELSDKISVTLNGLNILLNN